MIDRGCMGTLKIRRRDDSTTVIKLPYIKSIVTSVTASLTEISTIIYGYRNNFCMDLGTSQTITLKLERVNPMDYNDRSTDPEMWSNGKWYRWFEDQLDFWQNFGRDYDSGALVGGFTLELQSPDTELYPTTRYNVFMSGGLNMNYSNLQVISFSLPLQVSRMSGSTAQIEQVRLTLRTENALVPSDPKTMPYDVPKGFEVGTPSLPSGWREYQPGKRFRGWLGSSNQRYLVGTYHSWTEPETLNAEWIGAVLVKTYTIDDHMEEANNLVSVTGKPFGTGSISFKDFELEVPAGVTRVVAYGVGGGGGAGGGSINTLPAGSYTQYYCGGGGGAGEGKYSAEETVSKGDKITITLGRGGCGGITARDTVFRSNGQDGKPTIVKLNGTPILTCRGGAGGRATKGKGKGRIFVGASGGQTYVKGGDSTESGIGQDGSYSKPNIALNVGKGGSPHFGSTTLRRSQGGAGGGAAAFRYNFSVGSTWYPPGSGTTFYESKGGDGLDPSDNDNIRFATDGVFGGGGGSGRVDTHNDDGRLSAWLDGKDTYKAIDVMAGFGGYGAVILVFYNEV
nr:MAG TPA: hypothetical protein [Caudoviricetes sp.]